MIMEHTRPVLLAALALALAAALAPAPAAAQPWDAPFRGPAGKPAPGAEPPLPGGVIEGELDGRVVQLPLVRSHVSAQVAGDVATVEVVQTFANTAERPMHARYVFPLPPDAAVYALKLVTPTQVIEGEIRERQQAEKAYETAKAEGKQAALLTQERPNVFVQQVANLLPGGEVEIELRYAHAVPKKDGRYALHVPLVVGPRYLRPEPPGADVVEPLTLGQWILPATPPVLPTGAGDPGQVALEIELDGGVPIRWLDSPTHALDVTETGPTVRVVRPAEGAVLADRDFVLHYALAADKAAVGASAHARDGRGVVALHVEPPKVVDPGDTTPRELVFVLDCSGSMAGPPMDASKRFLREALGTLGPDDHFRVIRFSDTASGLGKGPLRATPENVARGLAFVESLRGEGGTEMSAGIRAALEPPPLPGALRIVVFLTDGYIGDDIQIVRMIQTLRGEARLFSFGVGNSVNRYLLEEMARAGRGVARILTLDEDVEAAAYRLAARLAVPYLTDVRIDWGAAPVEDPTPRLLPDLFAGERLRVLARFTKPGDFRVTVHGRVRGRAVTLPFDLKLPAAAEGDEALDVLWARGQVEDRMVDYLNPAADATMRAALQEEVTRLGLAHRLVTQWTAFVAIARDIVNPAAADTQTLDVPVAQVAGVGPAAYPPGTFGAAPEPATWLALALLLGLAAWRLRRQAERRGVR
jgi:Ca-activated chloride channel family protein